MKKILSLILVLTLVFSFGVTAQGAETDSMALEKAITAAKNVVEIPESFNDFNYSTSQTTINNKTYTYWNLSWNDISEGGNIYATVDEDGNLTNYYYYKSGEFDNQGLSKVTKEEGMKTALGFLAKAIPSHGKNMRYVESYYKDTFAQDYQYNFKLYVNNVPVDFSGATISVNRYTGEISNYYYNGIISDLKLVNYPSTDGEIGYEKAAEGYLSKIGIPLKYYSYFDYAKKTLKVFPVYELAYSGKAIDAKTGDVVNVFADDYGYPMGGEGMGSADSKNESAANEYTDEELQAIEKTQNLIDKEEAERIARSYEDNLGELRYVSLESHYIERDKYFWNMSFENGYSVVNASTRELSSLSFYEDTKYKGGNMTEDEAIQIGKAFIEKVAPEKADKVKFSENMYSIRDTEYPYYQLNFVRQFNDIDFVSNNIYISVNKDSGKITNYSCEWYDTAKFPSIEEVVKTEIIFEKAANAGNYGLTYKKIAEDEIALVYDFMLRGEMIFDPIKALRINRDGTLFVMDSEYNDIKGNWAEKMILELQENGYYLPGQGGNKFNPSNKTTQIEFLRYLHSPIQDQYTEDEAFYNMLIVSGIIKKEEVNPSKEIMRQDVAKFVCRYYGYEKLAQKTEIFRNFFRDTPASGYMGYASICYAFDIIRGDTSGNFSGEKAITHSEVAKVIYKTIENR